VQAEIVYFGESLVGGGSFEEVDVFLGVVLAIGQFVDFLLAGYEVAVALEEALAQIVEDGQTQWFDFQSGWEQDYALVL
jgi:hypothetical protein